MSAGDVLVADVALTWALVGLIWTVQVVLYPGLLRVGAGELAHFHTQHCARITWLVGPLMLGELGASLVLLWHPPEALSAGFLAAGAGLAALPWIVTASIAVPLHQRVAHGDRGAIESLIAMNWWRTGAWTAHGIWGLVATRSTHLLS